MIISSIFHKNAMHSKVEDELYSVNHFHLPKAEQEHLDDNRIFHHSFFQCLCS